MESEFQEKKWNDSFLGKQMDDEKEEPSVSYRFCPGKFIDFLTLSDQEKAEKATKFLIALIKGDSSICSDAKEMILDAMAFRSKKSAAGKAAMASRYGSKNTKPSPNPKRPTNVSPDGEVIEQAEIDFESFRVAFPGTRAGHDSALKLFKNTVGKAWREIVPKLLPAVELEKAWRKKCDDVGAWHQPWAMLTTWIRQRRWEQELAEPSAPAVQKTARQLENEKNERETAEWIQSLGKEKNAEPKGFLDDLSRDILGGMKNGQ